MCSVAETKVMQTHQGHQAHQSGGVSGRPRGEHSVLQSWLGLKQHKKTLQIHQNTLEKICNIIFGVENDPSPFLKFSK